jgi:thiamine-phosphate pyrophosphorylase
MRPERPWRGLYVITDRRLAAGRGLSNLVAAAISGGARWIQYRDKSKEPGRRRDEAAALARLCRRHQVPLIVNDDPRLAAEVEADGVHLGHDDSALRPARRLLGPSAIIGVSCYDRIDRARAAQSAGADYLAFGRFFPSRSKPQAVPAGLELLHAARRELYLPLVAIGGVTPENGRALVCAGADMLAVIHGVFGQENPARAAGAFDRCFQPEDTDEPIP